eukprot:scaffold86717_cov28-Tisochrysis_lutea.AAC.6
MFRGLWLKSQKGVREATRESILWDSTSAWLASPLPGSSIPYETRSVVCSRGPMSSTRPLRLRLETGRSGRAACDARYSAGGRREPPGKISAISSAPSVDGGDRGAATSGESGPTT